MAEKDGLGDRIGSFFRGRSDTKKSSSEEGSKVQIQQLQLEVQHLTTSERDLKNNIQQLQLEKSLLQKFVDQVCTADDDDSTQNGKVKDMILSLQSEKAADSLKTEKLSKELQEVEIARQTAEKKSTAYEMGLENANTELSNAEKQCRELQAQAQAAAEAEEKVRRLEQELASNQTTIAALMEKTKKVAQEKDQNEKDFGAMLQKTTSANDSTLQELNEHKEQLAVLQHQVHDLQSQATSNKTLSPEIEQELVELRKTKEVNSKEINENSAEIHNLRSHLSSTEQSLAETIEIKNKLERTVGELTVEVEQLHDTLRLHHVPKTTYEEALGKHKTDLSLAETEYKKLREESQAQIRELTDNLQAETHTIQSLEVTLLAKEDELHQLIRKLTHLTVEAEEKSKTLSEELKEVTGGKEAAEHQAAELSRQLEDGESEYKIKLRMSNNLNKDLQQQILKLEQQLISLHEEGSKKSIDLNTSNHSEREIPSNVVITDSLLQGENESLIQRVADLQERVWSLDSAKKTYEEELVRLNNDLTIKSNIILAHFSDAAKKHSTKFGAGLFGPSAAEVNTQLQAALEASLNDNMKLQGQLQQQKSALDHAMGVIGEAEAQGYIVVDSDKEDDNEDDKFQ